MHKDAHFDICIRSRAACIMAGSPYPNGDTKTLGVGSHPLTMERQDYVENPARSSLSAQSHKSLSGPASLEKLHLRCLTQAMGIGAQRQGHRVPEWGYKSILEFKLVPSCSTLVCRNAFRLFPSQRGHEDLLRKFKCRRLSLARGRGSET